MPVGQLKFPLLFQMFRFRGKQPNSLNGIAHQGQESKLKYRLFRRTLQLPFALNGNTLSFYLSNVTVPILFTPSALSASMRVKK